MISDVQGIISFYNLDNFLGLFRVQAFLSDI